MSTSFAAAAKHKQDASRWDDLWSSLLEETVEPEVLGTTASGLPQSSSVGLAPALESSARLAEPSRPTQQASQSACSEPSANQVSISCESDSLCQVLASSDSLASRDGTAQAAQPMEVDTAQKSIHEPCTLAVASTTPSSSSGQLPYIELPAEQSLLEKRLAASCGSSSAVEAQSAGQVFKGPAETAHDGSPVLQHSSAQPEKSCSSLSGGSSSLANASWPTQPTSALTATASTASGNSGEGASESAPVGAVLRPQAQAQAVAATLIGPPAAHTVHAVGAATSQGARHTSLRVSLPIATTRGPKRSATTSALLLASLRPVVPPPAIRSPRKAAAKRTKAGVAATGNAGKADAGMVAAMAAHGCAGVAASSANTAARVAVPKTFLRPLCLDDEDDADQDAGGCGAPSQQAERRRVLHRSLFRRASAPKPSRKAAPAPKAAPKPPRGAAKHAVCGNSGDDDTGHNSEDSDDGLNASDDDRGGDSFADPLGFEAHLGIKLPAPGQKKARKQKQHGAPESKAAKRCKPVSRRRARASAESPAREQAPAADTLSAETHPAAPTMAHATAAIGAAEVVAEAVAPAPAPTPVPAAADPPVHLNIAAVLAAPKVGGGSSTALKRGASVPVLMCGSQSVRSLLGVSVRLKRPRPSPGAADSPPAGTNPVGAPGLAPAATLAGKCADASDDPWAEIQREHEAMMLQQQQGQGVCDGAAAGTSGRAGASAPGAGAGAGGPSPTAALAEDEVAARQLRKRQAREQETRLLQDELRSWRASRARSLRRRPETFLSDDALEAVLEHVPVTFSQLLSTPCVSTRWCSVHGHELLDVVRNFQFVLQQKREQERRQRYQARLQQQPQVQVPAAPGAGGSADAERPAKRRRLKRTSHREQQQGQPERQQAKAAAPAVVTVGASGPQDAAMLSDAAGSAGSGTAAPGTSETSNVQRGSGACHVGHHHDTGADSDLEMDDGSGSASEGFETSSFSMEHDSGSEDELDLETFFAPKPQQPAALAGRFRFTRSPTAVGSSGNDNAAPNQPDQQPACQQERRDPDHPDGASRGDPDRSDEHGNEHQHGEDEMEGAAMLSDTRQHQRQRPSSSPPAAGLPTTAAGASAARDRMTAAAAGRGRPPAATVAAGTAETAGGSPTLSPPASPVQVAAATAMTADACWGRGVTTPPREPTLDASSIGITAAGKSRMRAVYSAQEDRWIMERRREGASCAAIALALRRSARAVQRRVRTLIRMGADCTVVPPAVSAPGAGKKQNAVNGAEGAPTADASEGDDMDCDADADVGHAGDDVGRPVGRIAWGSGGLLRSQLISFMEAVALAPDVQAALDTAVVAAAQRRRFGAMRPSTHTGGGSASSSLSRDLRGRFVAAGAATGTVVAAAAGGEGSSGGAAAQGAMRETDTDEDEDEEKTAAEEMAGDRQRRLERASSLPPLHTGSYSLGTFARAASPDPLEPAAAEGGAAPAAGGTAGAAADTATATDGPGVGGDGGGRGRAREACGGQGRKRRASSAPPTSTLERRRFRQGTTAAEANDTTAACATTDAGDAAAHAPAAAAAAPTAAARTRARRRRGRSQQQKPKKQPPAPLPPVLRVRRGRALAAAPPLDLVACTCRGELLAYIVESGQSDTSNITHVPLEDLKAAAEARRPYWEAARVLACQGLPSYSRPGAVLRVPAAAGREEIRAAYRRLSLLLHPDKNPSREAGAAFSMVRLAATQLNDRLFWCTPVQVTSP